MIKPNDPDRLFLLITEHPFDEDGDAYHARPSNAFVADLSRRIPKECLSNLLFFVLCRIRQSKSTAYDVVTSRLLDRSYLKGSPAVFNFDILLNRFNKLAL